MFQIGDKVKYRNYKQEWVYGVIEGIIPTEPIIPGEFRYRVRITGVEGWAKGSWTGQCISHDLMGRTLISMDNGIERARKCLNQNSK
jgi:hypothetical protein